MRASFSYDRVNVPETLSRYGEVQALILSGPTLDDAERRTPEMATKKAAAKERREVTLSIPDIGLSKTKIDSLKKKFQNELVSSLGAKMAAIRIIIIKVQRVRA